MIDYLLNIKLTTLDYSFIIGFFVIALLIGIVVAKKSGKNSGEFFLSGRSMPWWLLGFSMVATTFSTDTPNLVANLVRSGGIAGNWGWWAFLVSGLVTVFFYAKLWRRSRILTDLEFYSIRYSGKSASFLRCFRAIYLGVFINALVMGMVSLAAIKIGEVMLGWDKYQSVGLAMLVTVIFSSLGGFKGVILTDFLLFVISMVGSFGAAYFAVNHAQIDGLSNLFSHANVVDKVSLFINPQDSANNVGTLAALSGALMIPLLVVWWSTWYPGSEPGGGGYLAQRMLAAKNEKHAVGSVLFFNLAHYAIRPWPWIIVALASLIIYPTIGDLQAAFPNAKNIGDDSAYSAMLTFLPAGWLGLILTSLIAAYMSTISTHLNWGSSYVVNDIWKPYFRKNASEKELVWVGRLSTVAMMAFGAFIAFNLSNAMDAFNMLVALGSGTGGVLLARWYWWRVNAWSEISSVVAAAIIAPFFGITTMGKGIAANLSAQGISPILLQVVLITIIWIVVTYLTKPTDKKVLVDFVEKINPGGIGWSKVVKEANISPELSPIKFGPALLSTVFGCLFIYGLLFSAGYFLQSNMLFATIWVGISLISAVVMASFWKKAV